MADIKFELNRDGVAELMKSNEMQGIINDYEKKVLSACPDIGYEAETKIGKTRVSGTVRAVSAHAYYENRKNHTLQKALGAAHD